MYRFRQDFRPFPLIADGWQWVYMLEQYWDSSITATQRYNCRSLVTRVRLLGLSFRQCSFCLYRYIHLAVQPQLGNFVGLRRCRHAFVPVVVSLAGQPVDGGIFIPMPSSCLQRICYAHYMCAQYLPVDSMQTSLQLYLASQSHSSFNPFVKEEKRACLYSVRLLESVIPMQA